MKGNQQSEEIDYMPKLLLPPDKVGLKICEKIKVIDELTQKTSKSMEFGMWRRETETLLIHAFGPKAKQVHDFKEIRYFPMIYVTGMDTHPSYLSGLQSARECLLAIAKEITEFYLDNTVQSSEMASEKTPISKNAIANACAVSRKVFIVHGHDNEMKVSVASFLEKLGLQPIILHKQPNGGKTIIEKFEANADVAFAIVLMSPDDEGRERGKESVLNNRARQNVILELGYFIGHLGRARVCALERGAIEEPSDILGVLYVPYDANDGWKIQLGKELREAKMPIDDAKFTAAIMA